MSSEGEEGKLPPVDHDPLNEGAVGKSELNTVRLVLRCVIFIMELKLIFSICTQFDSISCLNFTYSFPLLFILLSSIEVSGYH
jgi:hypothetical protein